MIEANISDFDKKDAILFITTEDKYLSSLNSSNSVKLLPDNAGDNTEPSFQMLLTSD
jgi:hypothetical protein